MIPALLPSNESQRLEALHSLQLLDTPPEKAYDAVTSLASEIAQTPIALIVLVDKDRQWFKSKVGLPVKQTPREQAFCAHAILTPEQPTIVPDATADERFWDNPLVTGPPHIAFYAGFPLLDDHGMPLGSLCVIDSKPRQLAAQQLEQLGNLADLAMANIRLRQASLALREHSEEQASYLAKAQSYSSSIAHDLRSPAGQIASLANLLGESFADRATPEELDWLHRIQEVSEYSLAFITQLLNYSQLENNSLAHDQPVDLAAVAHQVTAMLPPAAQSALSLEGFDHQVVGNETALVQIVQNLVNNAVKHNDNALPKVEVAAVVGQGTLTISVADNGPGIAEEEQQAIFEPFHTGRTQTKRRSTGLGLAIVQRLVAELEGHVAVDSTLGAGATFRVRLPQ